MYTIRDSKLMLQPFYYININNTKKGFNTKDFYLEISKIISNFYIFLQYFRGKDNLRNSN